MQKRGISDDFLKPKYEDCVDPLLLPDMEKAVERIEKAVKNGEKVLVYGDYDVDGITASAVMHDALKLAGVETVDIMLPNRFKDGYGMSKKVVQRASEDKISLVVTVDCGSMNAEVVDELNENGVDVVVTDHHECPEKLPKAVAVVNPKRQDFEAGDSSVRELAGVGVAFELARALVKKKMIPEGQEKWLMDLVLIGTVCDSMRMVGENRRFCFFGVKVLQKTRRLGLRELMRICKIDKIDTEAIGFRIGPRLNAAGRMRDAETALKLLMTESRTEAANLARELDLLNQERKSRQVAAVNEIEKRGMTDDPVIVVEGDWHEGVLGIVAGKLVEEYKRPAFVFAGVEDGLKGSGRSFGEFDLALALRACRDVIVGGGGHAAACGVKLAKGGTEQFREKVNEYYRGLNLASQERFLEAEEDISVYRTGDFSVEFLEEVRQLEPFGEGNEEPVFLLKDVYVCDAMKMGETGKHLRLTVWGEDKKEFKAVAFGAEQEWLKVGFGCRVDMWVKIVENEWRGRKSVEGRIIKMTLVDDEVF